MLRTRRWLGLSIVGIVVFALVGLLADPSAGQFKKKGFPPDGGVVSTGNSAGLSSVKIIEDSQLRRYINVGRDCINDKDWTQAVEALQVVLALKKDSYVQVSEPDAANPTKSVSRWTSVKFEANNLLGSMPLDGLQVYELKFGPEAKTLLDEAKSKGDRDQIAEVAQRFCHTRAGVEANEILATLFLARGQVFSAALRYEKLLQMNPEWAKVSDLTLFKSAMAFERAGDKKSKDEAWERLTTSLKEKQNVLKVGADLVPLAKLEAAVKESTPINIVNVHDWPSWRGANHNSAQANGSPPLLDMRVWHRPLFMDKLDGFPDEDQDQEAQKRVQAAVDQANAANQPVMSGFFPIASQGIMVYRNHRGLVAVALKELEFKSDDGGEVTKIKPGEIVWKSIPMNRSLAMLLEKPATRARIGPWLDNYNQVPGFNSFLYDNTMIGTLSTDHRNVYAINDLAVPPHPNMFMFNQFNPQMNQFNAQELKPLVMQNQLLAYDLMSGKVVWDLNPDDAKDEDPVFKNSHFLSLPITVGGKLYVLNEKLLNPDQGAGQPFNGQFVNPIGGESEIRLVCIDPTKLNGTRPAIVGDPQTLGNVIQHNRMVQDIGRRVNAVQLAYGEGILVCPTNAGEVFGIDLMSRSLVWSYPYREKEHQQIVLPGMQFQPQPFPGNPNRGQGTTVISKWKSSPPAIQDGRIVFTAPDADSVHCVNLRDGKPVWKKAQGKGDLYMAGVFKGKVVIVGESNIRALDLKTGSQVWSIHTGDLPSGQGVASKDIYYLPLKKGEILAVDLVKGEVKAHNRAGGAGSAPGNLVFYDNMVLSQTPTEVIAYPQLSARLDSAKLDAGKDPENLTKLTDYGELLLKDGQVHIAVETLLKVYRLKPADPLSKRVNERLFEALTDLMHIDFNKADMDHMETYKALYSVPDNAKEEQNRKAKFFRLVGQGREAQGKLVEAFRMYKEFGALPMHREQGGIASPEDPNQKIPINVWLRGRISGMIAKALPEQRIPLEAKIAEEWKEVEGKKDPDAIRSFVGMFDIPFRVGREARIRLAESIMERNERASFLEAELLLHQVMGSEYRSDPQSGGRALADLAQLEEKKGTVDSMRLAAAYYRELGRDFAKAPVRGTKTGSDLVNELATDKRFLGFLEEAGNPFGSAKLGSRELGAGTFQVGLSGFLMQADGGQTPFSQQNHLLLDPSDTTNPRLRLRDAATNQDRWSTNLGHVPMNQQLFNHLYQQANVNYAYQPNARFRFYQVKGHLIVCQVGIMVYCLDGDTGKKLWEMQTVENVQNNGLVHLQQVVNDQEGNPVFMFWNQLTNQRFPVTMGRVGAAQASYVAVLGHKGLTVVDPLRGTVLWKRSDVGVNSHVFGDDQYLFLAETNDNGGFGAGVTLRANDGEVLKVADFSNVYQSRIRTAGRRILAAQPGGGVVNVRLYDILTGKDVWTKQFPAGSMPLQSEDRNITGVIDPTGKLTVLDADTGNELVSSNLVQGRITAQDIKGLSSSSLLLQDNDRFYIALNKPVDGARVAGGFMHNNFNNGTRCLTVNGWFLAVHRHDGAKKIGGRDVAWKKGDLAWHSYMPVQNQMIVLEQFDQSPIVLFTARYNEILPNGGNRWVSVTQSLHKANGKMVYDSGPRQINGASPMFSVYQMDLKARTINLIGFSGSVQHYVDDGKGPPPMPQGAMLNPGIPQPGGVNGIVDPGAMLPPRLGVLPANGLVLPNVRINRRIIVDDIQIIPAPDLPVEPKR